MAMLDRERYWFARQKHDVANALAAKPASAEKYFDVAFWVRSRLWLAKHLGLFDGPPRRILDIGPGAGDFGALCLALGHDVFSIDIDRPASFNAIYGDLCAAFGVKRVISPVVRLTPLPDFGQFDLVVALATLFDRYLVALSQPMFKRFTDRLLRRDPPSEWRHWTLDDWRFFLRDLSERHLTGGGSIYLHPNVMVMPNGEHVRNFALMDACVTSGATANRTAGSIHFQDIRSPIVLSG